MAMHQCYWRLLQHPARNPQSQVPTHPSLCNSLIHPTSQSLQPSPQSMLPYQNPKALGPSWCQGVPADAIVSLPKPPYNTTINLHPLCLLSHTQNRCQTKSCPYTLTSRSLNHMASKELTQLSNPARNVNLGIKPGTWLPIHWGKIIINQKKKKITTLSSLQIKQYCGSIVEYTIMWGALFKHCVVEFLMRVRRRCCSIYRERGDVFPSVLLCLPFQQSQYFAAGEHTEQLRNYLFKR